MTQRKQTERRWDLGRWIRPSSVSVSADGKWLEWQYPAWSSGYTARGRGRRADLWTAFQGLDLGSIAAEADRERSVRARRGLELFARAWGSLTGTPPRIAGVMQLGGATDGPRGREQVAFWLDLKDLCAALERIGITGRLDTDDRDRLTELATEAHPLTREVLPQGLRRIIGGGPRRELQALDLVHQTTAALLVPNCSLRLIRDPRSLAGLRTDVYPTRLLGGLALALLKHIQSGGIGEPRECPSCQRLFRARRSDELYCLRCRRNTRVRARERKRRSKRRTRPVSRV